MYKVGDILDYILDLHKPLEFSETIDSNYFKGNKNENIRTFKQLCSKYYINVRELNYLNGRFGYLFNENVFEKMTVDDIEMEIKLYTSKELVIIQKSIYENQILVVEKYIEKLKPLLSKEMFVCFEELYLKNRLLSNIANDHCISQSTIKRKIKNALDKLFEDSI